MFRILLVILILLPTISNADQGLKILCLNMKSMYSNKYEPLKFTLEAVGFQYFADCLSNLLKTSFQSCFLKSA